MPVGALTSIRSQAQARHGTTELTGYTVRRFRELSGPTGGEVVGEARSPAAFASFSMNQAGSTQRQNTVAMHMLLQAHGNIT